LEQIATESFSSLFNQDGLPKQHTKSPQKSLRWNMPKIRIEDFVVSPQGSRVEQNKLYLKKYIYPTFFLDF